MPNRIIREGIISSPRVDELSMGAEVFYRRLMSVVDDYGRFYAIPSTLRGACWPTRPEKAPEDDICVWLAECVEQQLIHVFEVKGRRFLQVADFKQQVRAKSKFPECDSNCVVVAAHMLITSRSRSRISESETHTESACAAQPPSETGKLVCVKPAPVEMPCTLSSDWVEFIGRYPLKKNLTAAERQFAKAVTLENRAAVFACLERYLASDQVRRGVVMNPDNWLSECGADNWRNDWPRPREPSKERRSEVLAGLDAIDRLKGRSDAV